MYDKCRESRGVTNGAPATRILSFMERRRASKPCSNAPTLITDRNTETRKMALSSSLSSSVSSAGSSSASASTSTPSGVARTKSWHVPGPSTRYHKSEHARPKPTPRSSTQHVRNQSSLSTPSSYNEASASASPLARLNFNRDSPKDYSYNPNDTIKPSRNSPATPLRSPHNNFNNLRFQNSPFSDYFTDDARSVEHNAPYHPSDPAQKLLLRLNNLGSDILRLGLQNDSVSDFSEKLCSLEAMVHDAAYSDAGSLSEERDRRNSFPGRLAIEDQPQSHEARERLILSPDQAAKSRLSDVWIADACEYADTFTQTDLEFQQTPSAPEYAFSSIQVQQEEPQDDIGESGVLVANYAEAGTQTTNDRLVADLQDVVERLAKANDSLRHRYDQNKEVSDLQSVQIEELSTQIMTIKSENESLKQDLGFDHSELLFLKLQLQAIEVQRDSSGRGNHVLLAEDLVKWKADWDNVDARLRSRRQKNRVPSAAIKDLPDLGEEITVKPEDQGNWQLETSKHRHGRVRSITLKRVDEPESQVDEASLVDAQFDIPASPVVKTVYCEQSTQTEDEVVVAQNTQAEEPLSEVQNIQTDAETQTEVETEELALVEESEDKDESEAVEEDICHPQPSQTPVKEQEHLCRACGNKVDYSSEEDEEVNTKTPWQELCDGLVAFAGMQRE